MALNGYVAFNTGHNFNESGQQATGGIQVGNNTVSKVINISHGSEAKEFYYCSLKRGTTMLGGFLHISKTILEFRSYAQAGLKVVMPLHQVKVVKPLAYGVKKVIQIKMTNGEVNEFLSFGNFDSALRSLLEVKPHPYLSFPSVKTMIEESYCVQGYFSEKISREDILQYGIAIQIRESYRCIHDSCFGQLKGTIYISSRLFEFCSDDPVSYHSGKGKRSQEGCYYKLTIPFSQFKELHGHGPPDGEQMDSVPSWRYGCWQTPSIIIRARPPMGTQLDKTFDENQIPEAYDFKFMAIQGFSKCYAGLAAVFSAIHKKKDGKCCH